jgi:hypothetical protein
MKKIFYCLSCIIVFFVSCETTKKETKKCPYAMNNNEEGNK